MRADAGSSCSACWKSASACSSLALLSQGDSTGNQIHRLGLFRGLAEARLRPLRLRSSRYRRDEQGARQCDGFPLTARVHGRHPRSICASKLAPAMPPLSLRGVERPFSHANVAQWSAPGDSSRDRISHACGRGGPRIPREEFSDARAPRTELIEG